LRGPKGPIKTQCFFVAEIPAGAETKERVAVDVLLPDESTPELYGRISAQLAQAGTSIPQNDIWIAAIALQSDLPMATADRHFQHVIGLTVLLW
jgi:predicted nucleic acid-binding protein